LRLWHWRSGALTTRIDLHLLNKHNFAFKYLCRKILQQETWYLVFSVADPAGSGSWMKNSDHISECLETIFFWFKFFEVGPGSGIEKIRILDPGWKKFGSGPRNSHCIQTEICGVFLYKIPMRLSFRNRCPISEVMAPPLYTQAAVCTGKRAAHPVPDCPHLRRGQLAPAQLARLSHHLGGSQVCQKAKFLFYFYVIILRKTLYRQSML
jgi:hypothetical protein